MSATSTAASGSGETVASSTSTGAVDGQELWVSVGEAAATPVDEDSFWYVMEKWREHPEFIWRAVAHCEVARQDNPNVVTRKIIPKECAGGSILYDTVTFVKTSEIASATFSPIVADGPTPWKLFPKFYPKVKHLSFVFALLPKSPEPVPPNPLPGVFPSTSLTTSGSGSATTSSTITNENVEKTSAPPGLAPVTSINSETASATENRGKKKMPKVKKGCDTSTSPPLPLVSALSVKVVFFPEPGDSYVANMKTIAAKSLKKLQRWALTRGTYKKTAVHDQLIPKYDYVQKYEQLKKKYCHWVDEWKTRKQTQKYVYEDIGIASYFICLCEAERKVTGQTALQRFVDLGCGNGFLVNILTSEGYPGYGIDLNERVVWNGYNRETTKLVVQQFDPSRESLLDTDWIIGNHADELTPWISVVAAHSNYNVKFLSIPCCFHDFSGRFHGNDHNQGRYKTYLQWLEQVAETCGYQAERDYMRIPSTKNVCLVGRRRTFPESDSAAAEQIQQQIRDMLAKYPQFVIREIGAKNRPQHSHRHIPPTNDPGNSPQDSGSTTTTTTTTATGITAQQQEQQPHSNQPTTSTPTIGPYQQQTTQQQQQQPPTDP
ncbi:tRNA methyltransferase 44 [Pelomyxa schiedti]|nr:tRNA methyltransferase 44 [Pelomyxa schiedti]